MGLDGALLRIEHGHAAYVVVDLADIDGGIPQPVTIPISWNAMRMSSDLQAKCQPIIARAIAAGASWEMSTRKGIVTALVYVPEELLPIMTPAKLSKALSTIEAGQAAQGGTHAH